MNEKKDMEKRFISEEELKREIFPKSYNNELADSNLSPDLIGAELVRDATQKLSRFFSFTCSETKRENNNQNIFDTKYFFISSDQSLRRWDYQREDKTPIVLLPSQWMSILLRYLNRTEDDFKSFVSFLNLKNSEVLINSEKLHIVLAGIAEMTTSIEQQRFILNNLVENKFNSVVSRSMSNEQIFENAKKYAKSKLENEVEKLKIQNNDLTGKYNEISADITVHKTAVTSEIQHLKDEKEGIKRKLSDKEQENIHLKEQLIESEIKAEMRKWQEPAKWLIALGFLIILFMTLQFCCKTWSLNYPYKLVMWIETITNTVQKTTLTTLMYAPLIGLWLISKFVWSRLISKDKKSETKLKIKNNVTVKYK